MPESEYHVFECAADGGVMWRCSVHGLMVARRKLHDLARFADGEVFAMQLPSREIVFRADPARRELNFAPRVFQVAYTEKLRDERADLLRSIGYGVLSVLGNAAAKHLLMSVKPHPKGIAWFMIGHGAPQKEREHMAEWLRAHFPESKILALNPANEHVSLAHHNVKQNGPEVWLPLFQQRGNGNEMSL